MSDQSLLSGGPEEIRRKLNAMVQDAERRSERFSAVRQQIESSTIDEESPDGAVRVSVRASGALAGLQLSDRVRQLAPSQIASLVMATVGRAQGKIAQRVRQIAEDNGVGADPATATMVARFTDEFPESEPEESPKGSGELNVGRIEEDTPKPAPPRPARPARPEPRQDDDGYWDQQSFLRKD